MHSACWWRMYMRPALAAVSACCPACATPLQITVPHIARASENAIPCGQARKPHEPLLVACSHLPPLVPPPWPLSPARWAQQRNRSCRCRNKKMHGRHQGGQSFKAKKMPWLTGAGMFSEQPNHQQEKQHAHEFACAQQLHNQPPLPLQISKYSVNSPL